MEGKRYPWGVSNPCIRCFREMYKPGKREVGKIRYHAKGLCNTCYSGTRLGQNPRKYIHFDEHGQTCSKCVIYQPFASFAAKNVKTLSGHTSWCRTCQVMYKFSISKVEYDELLADQGGVCAICKSSPSDGGKALAVDHDHACCPTGRSCGKCIRGLLCASCNQGIGLLGDTPEKVLVAYEYLKESTIVKSK